MKLALTIAMFAAWLVAAGGWLYGTRFFLPMWAAGFKPRPKHSAYPEKALKGFLVGLVGFAAFWAIGLGGQYFGVLAG